MVAGFPIAGAQRRLGQQLALHLRRQLQIALQRHTLLLREVVEAVAHQRIGKQPVLLHRLVARFAKAVLARGHAVQRGIHLAEQLREARILRRPGHGRFQSPLALLELTVQKSNLYCGHHSLG